VLQQAALEFFVKQQEENKAKHEQNQQNI